MMTNTANPGDSWASLKAQYEYIMVGADAAGSVRGAELSKAGAMGEQRPRMFSLRRCHGCAPQILHPSFDLEPAGVLSGGVG
jgi:hypothetical protein